MHIPEVCTSVGLQRHNIQEGVTHIFAVVTAATGTQYAEEGVELLRILQYITKSRANCAHGPNRQWLKYSTVKRSRACLQCGQVTKQQK